MIDEGSRAVMTELILQEKEAKEKMAAIDAALAAPLARLARARELVLKAKGAFEKCLEEVRPLKSDRVLLEGELERIAEKKSEARMEARRIEVGGIRPGTADFVDRMNELAGDPKEAALRKATKEMEAAEDLEALKRQMGEV